MFNLMIDDWSDDWPDSDPVWWQNSYSGCNSEINLVVVLEYTFFQLYSKTEQISWVHEI